MNRPVQVLVAAFLSFVLTACATPGSSPAGSTGEMEIRAGRIEQINPTTMESSHHAGVGAIAGGLAGAALGSLIGAGTGRDVAMVAGAIAGGIGGNYAQEKYDKPQPAQQVIVRINNGVLVSIIQPINNALTTGMRVYIEGSGTSARVVPAT